MIKNLIFAVTIAAMMPFAGSAQTSKTLYGTLVNGGADNLPVGVYSVSLNPDEFDIVPISTNGDIDAKHGAMIVGDELHFISETPAGELLYNQFNRQSWQPSAESKVISADFNTADLLYNEIEDVVYGCFYGKNSTNENPDRESYSLIGKTEYGYFNWELMTEMSAIEEVMALGMNVSGVVFAVGTMGGMWHIDQTDGVTVYTMMTPSYDYMIKKDTQYALVFDPVEPYVAYLLCVMRGQDDGTWKDETLLWKLEPQLRRRTLIGSLPKGVEFSSLWFDDSDATGIVRSRAETVRQAGIFDMRGRKVANSSTERGNLCPGIYIENGKKIAISK